MSTRNRLELQTLGTHPIMPKNLPITCLSVMLHKMLTWQNFGVGNDDLKSQEGHFTLELQDPWPICHWWRKSLIHYTQRAWGIKEIWMDGKKVDLTQN